MKGVITDEEAEWELEEMFGFKRDGKRTSTAMCELTNKVGTTAARKEVKIVRSHGLLPGSLA